MRCRRARRIVAGRVESGTLAVGDTVVFLPSAKRTQVLTIEAFNAESPRSVSAGYSTGVTLAEQLYVNRGDPSIMVERRFGFGYTVNFGNPRAVMLLGVFLAAVLGLTIVALVTS